MSITSIKKNAAVQKLLRVLSIFRFTPFDSSTEVGRSRERERRAAWSALAAVLAKVVSVAAALITVPLTLKYLGKERYGMWMTMSSVITMLSFADFGIGNGILSAVAHASGKDDIASIRRSISSGLCALCVIAVGILLLFFALYGITPWYRIFNVLSPAARDESGPAMAALVLCFALAVPLTVVQRVQMGLQRGFLANIWQSASSVLSFIAIVIAIVFHAGLPVLVLAFAGTPLLAALLNGVVYFGWTDRAIAPSTADVSFGAMRLVAQTGGLYFVIQIVAALMFASDNIVIAHVVSADAVAEFSVPQKIFSFVPILGAMMMAPLWPAYGEAISRGDNAWARRTLIKSFFVAIGGTGAVCLLLVMFGSSLIHAWVSGLVPSSLSLLIGLAVWQVMQAGGTAVSMFLNGANVVKFQVIFASITGVVMVVAKIAAGRMAGTEGVVWSCSICYAIFTCLPMYWYIRKYFAQRTVST